MPLIYWSCLSLCPCNPFLALGRLCQRSFQTVPVALLCVRCTQFSVGSFFCWKRPCHWPCVSRQTPHAHPLWTVGSPSPLAGMSTCMVTHPTEAHNNLRPALSCAQPSVRPAHHVSRHAPPVPLYPLCLYCTGTPPEVMSRHWCPAAQASDVGGCGAEKQVCQLVLLRVRLRTWKKPLHPTLQLIGMHHVTEQCSQHTTSWVADRNVCGINQSCWPRPMLKSQLVHTQTHYLDRNGCNRTPRCGMRMLYANLYHTGTRMQSNKVRTKSSSVTLPQAPFAVVECSTLSKVSLRARTSYRTRYRIRTFNAPLHAAGHQVAKHKAAKQEKSEQKALQ